MSEHWDATAQRGIRDCLHLVEGAVVADFPCRLCPATAATVALVPPGHAIPHGPPLKDGRRLEMALPGWSIVVIGVVAVHGLVDPGLVDAIRAGVSEGDAASLFDVAADFLSSYCPSCPDWYCPAHWRLETFFDEGFYDYTMGTCPSGHSRMVDD